MKKTDNFEAKTIFAYAYAGLHLAYAYAGLHLAYAYGRKLE